MNNAAHQTGSALGVALLGAIAADPLRGQEFVSRLGWCVAVGAAVFTVALVLTGRAIQVRRADLPLVG